MAKQSDDTSRVNFLSLDFKDLQLPEESLDGALFLEVVGLVSREEDQKNFLQVKLRVIRYLTIKLGFSE